MSVKDDLIKVKEVLLKRGRTTGGLVDTHTGCACLLGAVGLAVYGDGWYPEYSSLYGDTPAGPVVSALAEVLPNQDEEDLLDRIWKFNDRIVYDDYPVFSAINQAIEAAA